FCPTIRASLTTWQAPATAFSATVCRRCRRPSDTSKAKPRTSRRRTMSDDAKKRDIKLVEGSPDSVFDDIERLRKTATLKDSRKVVPVTVRVGKPANNVYFRVHPEPGWSLDCSVIVGDGGSDDFYFVTPSMLNHHTILPRLRKVSIVTVYTWPSGAISLWPVP